jgi:hypothetical protein
LQTNEPNDSEDKRDMKEEMKNEGNDYDNDLARQYNFPSQIIGSNGGYLKDIRDDLIH